MIDNACLEPHVKVLVITKNPLSDLNSTTNRKQSIKQEGLSQKYIFQHVSLRLINEKITC